MHKPITGRTPAFIGAILSAALSALTLIPTVSQAAAAPVYLDQGAKWSGAERKIYYSQDQGSQIIPLKWINALKQANGLAFMADNLGRYGYLPNETAPVSGLPLGFTTNGEHLGMTCAACHTRQIEVDNIAYRIDGGPAIVDFQSFAADLKQAVTRLLNDNSAFTDFAQTLLGASATPAQQAQLRKDVETWYLPYSTIMDIGLPKDHPWGPGRADAVGMIFNRVTGLDIGTGPDHMIKSNMHTADAPVRYPFVWNAPIQDKTQWPGFADNGNDLLGLARNLGEVFGVFGRFYPQKDDWRILGVDYLQTNSANFTGLETLESLVKKIGPPQWPWKKGPWAINQSLADQGKAIFYSKSKTEDGGCAGCHGVRKGALRSSQETWATPLCNVNTDTRQFSLLGWKVETGVLAGALIPVLQAPLAAKDEAAATVLGTAVIGSILQHKSTLAMELESAAKKEITELEHLLGNNKADRLQAKITQLRQMQAKLLTPENEALKGAFRALTAAPEYREYRNASCKDEFQTKEPVIAYEARVLEGIWATAPYLHNGSIPTLEDLLKPAAQRTASFKIGPAYDPVKVGLAAKQNKFDFTYQTTDCSKTDSGNSRCGHEFGTKLPSADKAALLEYLKTL